MFEWARGKGRSDPDVKKGKGKAPAGNHPDLGRVLFYLLDSCNDGIVESLQ
jgi:hypothetical protein